MSLTYISGIFTACISNPFWGLSKSWMSEFTLHSNFPSQNLPQSHLTHPANTQNKNLWNRNQLIFFSLTGSYSKHLWVWIQLPSFELIIFFFPSWVFAAMVQTFICFIDCCKRPQYESNLKGGSLSRFTLNVKVSWQVSHFKGKGIMTAGSRGFLGTGSR